MIKKDYSNLVNKKRKRRLKKLNRKPLKRKLIELLDVALLAVAWTLMLVIALYYAF